MSALLASVKQLLHGERAEVDVNENRLGCLVKGCVDKGGLVHCVPIVSQPSRNAGQVRDVDVRRA